MLVPEAGIRIADRYQLTRKLGEGGMGSVWAAHDDKLRREVAIKLLTERIAESAKALGRFEREAMAVARLRSPYITQVYDYGIEDGSPYIIMELLAGEDLKEVLARDSVLSVEQTARLVVQVAKALHAAHESGIVHRDLKPANVFIASEHGEQVCKVFDFGVAKALTDLGDDSDTTAEGALLGTPRYMSPEQAHGAKRVDHRSDLWSLGVIAYLCLTGRLPFMAVGTGHVLVKICTETPPAPSEVNDRLGPEIDDFFVRALAKEPESRFQSAQEMGMAFAGLADLSLSGNATSSPSWEGLSRGRLSTPSLGDVSMGSQADLSFDPSSPQISRELLHGASFADGTLGPAVTVVPKPWLGSRRARVGAFVFALVAVCVLLGVAFTRESSVRGGVGPAASAAVEPPALAAGQTAQPASEVAPATDAAPMEPSGSPRAKASGAASTKPPAASKRRPSRAAPTPSVPVAAPSPDPVTPKPSPAPKPKGDGLDLFDKRF